VGRQDRTRENTYANRTRTSVDVEQAAAGRRNFGGYRRATVGTAAVAERRAVACLFANGYEMVNSSYALEHFLDRIYRITRIFSIFPILKIPGILIPLILSRRGNCVTNDRQAI